jgi:hypothetical protein
MKNKFEIVEAKDYILAISDEEITDGLYLTEKKTLCNVVKKDDKYVYSIEAGSSIKKNCKKIIAYQPKGNAEELDLPLLPQIVVEEEVDEIFEKETKTVSFGENGNQSPYNWFKMGYNAATKEYSEEDLRKAFEAGMYFVGEDKGSYEEFIQSLKQPKTPKWFVADREKLYHAKRKGTTEFQDTKGYYSWILKTTTINGKTYLVGTYLFE